MLIAEALVGSQAMGAGLEKTVQVQNLTVEELGEIGTRCDKATPGPWTSYIEERERFSGSDFIMTQGEGIYLSRASKFDQDFIACARQEVPKLIAEILRLWAGAGRKST
jgi:hypothetical protein